MYPTEPTHTEELISHIQNQSPKTPDIIKELIDNHDTSAMENGVRYYFNDTDIVGRKIYTYENGAKVVDNDATNEKLPASWHKRLVDQKVGYLVGKPVTLASDKENDPALERIQEIIGDEFDDTMPELVKHASNKGREFLHPYIDDEGQFDYMIVPAQECIPIYTKTKKRDLEAVIRYYDVGDIKKIELWDSEQVTYYEEIDGKVHYDAGVEQNPQSHFYYGNKGYGWGKVPFVDFRNNEECISDLKFYKRLIDAYELIISNTANTIVDVQSLIYVLKGYEGQDLDEFMTNLKKYKAISVSDEPGSGVDTLQADIPVNAVDSHADRLEQLIYDAGQGVNFSADKLGNNPSGVSLKFLYTALDLKASVLERKFSKSLREFTWFICEYLSIAENVKADYQDYTWTFNKSIITNEAEIIKNLGLSQSMLSDETILTNHPYVDDVQAELDKRKAQQDEYMQNMPGVEVNEPE
ncbi:phage portal protein [Virgibacillus siamensis]|uniref:phage portal protein n=1 Tax=Virgibacillus siamensis TaxID=480071 RepID=UPI001C379A0A|nr:phage portal protein [Virgibacillus siamensis]